MKFSKKLRTKTMKFRGGNVVKALKELKIGRIDELIQELENVQKKMKEVKSDDRKLSIFICYLLVVLCSFFSWVT